MIDIDITTNFKEVALALGRIKGKILEKAVRRSVNRTLTSARKMSILEIKKQIKIPSETLRRRHMELIMAKGKFPGGMYGEIGFSIESIAMLNFVKGNKTVQSQKGIPVDKRRLVKVEITPGKSFALKKAFIQRKHSVQVFKRTSKGEFKKQGTRSVGFIVMERGIAPRLAPAMQLRFRELFFKDLQARINGYVPEPRKRR